MVIFVYTYRFTLENVKLVWIPEVCKAALERPCFVLVQTKIDLDMEERGPSVDDVKEIIKKFQCKGSYRCSALKPNLGDTLNYTFTSIISLAWKHKYGPKNTRKVLNLRKSLKNIFKNSHKTLTHSHAKLKNVEVVNDVIDLTEEEIRENYEKLIKKMKSLEKYDERNYYLCMDVDVAFWKESLGLSSKNATAVLDYGIKKEEIEIKIKKKKKNKIRVFYLLERKLPAHFT